MRCENSIIAEISLWSILQINYDKEALINYLCPEEVFA